MKNALRSLACVLPALPIGLAASYMLLPVLPKGLRLFMFIYCALVCYLPYFLFLYKRHLNALAGVTAFMLSQFFRIMALLVCGVFFYYFNLPVLRPALELFLVFVGAFLFFQLASAGGGRFCGS